jgi:hypothetical protein
MRTRSGPATGSSPRAPNWVPARTCTEPVPDDSTTPDARSKYGDERPNATPTLAGCGDRQSARPYASATPAGPNPISSHTTIRVRGLRRGTVELIAKVYRLP